jgi:hypothetical protein
MDKGYIVCAAIHWDDSEVHIHQPKEIETGLVVCGRRHHNCYAILSQITNLKEYKLRADAKKIVQGFLTSGDYFVNRVDGAKIAFERKQTIKEREVLFSEDLY